MSIRVNGYTSYKPNIVNNNSSDAMRIIDDMKSKSMNNDKDIANHSILKEMERAAHVTLVRASAKAKDAVLSG